MIEECKTENLFQCFDNGECILSIRKIDENTFNIMNADGTFEVFCEPINDYQTKIRFCLYRPSNRPKTLYKERLSWCEYILEAKGFIRKSKAIKRD